MSSLVTSSHSWIRKGILDHADLKHIWKDKEKFPPSLHSTLLLFMEKFDVVIPITHLQSERIYEGKSVVPAVLPDEEPEVINAWDKFQIQIHRICKFPFFPPQFFLQIISTLLPVFGIEHCIFWRNGIQVSEKRSSGLIRLLSANQITLSFCGNGFSSTFQKVFHSLHVVLKQIGHLEFQEFIVCPKCLQTKRPNFLTEPCFRLLDLISENKITDPKNIEIVCPKSKELFKIFSLIPELSVTTIHNQELEREVEHFESGAFARLFKGKYKGEVVAIKMLFPDLATEFEDKLHDFIEEIQWLNYGHHPNIMEIIGITLNPPSIVLPYAIHGSLFKYLHNWQDDNEDEELWTAVWNENVTQIKQLVIKGAKVNYQTKRWYQTNSVN